jgi:alpha-1,6-mannosyltransferase
MKILDLAEFYSERGGGVRSYLDKLVRAAERHGHEVTVVAPGPRDEEISSGPAGKVIRYAAPRMPYDSTYHAPIGIRRMRHLIRATNPDVLQVSSPFLPVWVAKSVESSALRAYVYHSDPIGSYLEPLATRWFPSRFREALVTPAWAYMRAVCRQFDVTVVASHWLEASLKQRGCQRVETAPFGIDHADFSTDLRDLALRRELLGELASDPRSSLLLVAGRLAVDKRQARLIEAMIRVAERRPVGLLLLGDGPERERLCRLGARLPRFRWLAFSKNRTEYARILASADALVHGSVSETYGFVLAEALASGTPLVVPDVAGARAISSPECSERYSPEARPEEIARAIERLLDRPRSELSKAARNRADTIPSMDDHFTSLFALYAERLARQRHSAL